ncbi:MAG TPA: Ig-like domain-containing protein [Gemmatimonadales bacterium]|nr:Ig-like domain-containing protein [Gemmatimonadales bacterium]
MKPMTLTSKLSSRLGLLKNRRVAWSLAVLAAAVVFACEKPNSITGTNATVSQLVVSPNTATVQPNQVQDFTAVGFTTAGDTAQIAVAWSTTGGVVDTNSVGGLHYGHYHNGTCGQFSVTATSTPGNLTASASVTVACAAPVATVTISPSSVNLQNGQTSQLTATLKDANGNVLTGRTVTWSSDNGAVATVSGAGLVTAAGAGSATITALSEGQSGTASVTVSSVPVASVTVSPATASLTVGQTAQLTATPKDANGNPLVGRPVTWTTSNGSVATVNTTGLVSAAGAGSATITATSEGQSGTAAVTVTAPTGVFAIGDSVQATSATWVRNISQPPADPATGTPPSVIGTQPAGARGVVDSGPVLNTTAGGDGAIRYHILFAAAPSGWVVQDYLAKIVPTVPVASVTVTPATASLTVGQTVQLTATPKDANGNPLTGRVITWQSSDNTIASVSSSGLVTGVGAGGPVTITATSEGQSGTATVNVSLAPVASVTVSPSSANIAITGTVQLTATPKDANGNPLSGRAISWASSNTNVATVNTSGLVTGVTAGSVTITATSEGQSGTATITVAGAPVASVTVTPASASVQAGQTVQLTATLKDANGNILTGRTVTWSSNTTTVATVSSSGLVTTTVAGSATITATSEGQSGTSAITVTAVPVASVTVTPATASVAAGGTVQLTATPKDANGNPLTGRVITWQSSNSAIASVNGSGLVTGVVAGGPVTITATSEGQSGTSAVTVTAASAAQFDHIFIVMEENNDYASVTSSSMPYLTGLAAQYGLATQYYANTHPSIGNYFEITGGQIITNNDSYGSTVSSDNVIRHLVAAGKSWKSYDEDLPSVGFVQLDYDDGNYASRHNTIVHYTDVHDNPAQAQNVVPFTQFTTDLANGAVPNYSFIVPNLCNDAHDCSLNTADSWLQTNIDPLVKSAFFQQNNCLLIIVFDESGGDNTNGGGRVYWVAVSPTKSKRGYQSTTLYQHQSTLRLMLKGLGVTSFPGDAATAPDMSEFFNP